MPSRPDLRELASNVREAFAEMDRDALLDILAFVVKEYLVEGPPPMLIHQAETLSDLKPANFAQLVTALQTRFDFPELAMLVVDGDQVSARVGGVVQPLLAARNPSQPGGNVQFVDTRPAQDPPPPPRPVQPQPGVSVVEANLAPRAAPPPTRGLSIRGRNSDEAPAAAPPPAAPPPAAPPAAPPRAAAEGGAPPKADPATPTTSSGGDDASARFSLLELD